MITVSNTEIQTFLRCPRRWFVTYYLGYQPAEEEVTGNRILGVRVHCALEGLYGYGLDPLAVLGVLYQIEIDASPEFESELLAERDLASAMVEGYIEWVAAEGKDAGLTVTGTETDLTVPLPGVPGVQLRAKLDQVVFNEVTGFYSFLDFKTAASFERHEVLDLDPQFKFYSMMQWLAEGEDLRVDGGILRTLRRVKRTDRSRPPYYATDEFRYNPEMINSTLLKAQRVGYRIKGARQALDYAYAPDGGQGDLDVVNLVQRSLFPPNEIPHDCKWSCPLASGLCPMMSDGSSWAGALMSGDRFEQKDPYDYYLNDPLRRVRQVLAAQ